jgi:hypothetical protein
MTALLSDSISLSVSVCQQTPGRKKKNNIIKIKAASLQQAQS